MDLFYAFVLIPLDSEVSMYALFFTVLIFSGLGLPMPEEIILIVGGYLAYLGFVHFWTMFYVLVAGILAADIIGYLLGRFAGGWATQKIKKWEAGERFLKKAEEHFVRHSEKVVLFSRVLVGVRVLVPMLAGHFRMRFGKFILCDTLVAVPWTFALVSLSYYFGLGLDLVTEVKEIKHFMFAIVGIVILAFAGVKLWKQRDRFLRF